MNEESIQKQIKEKNIVVGFWLRLLSDVLDVIFLGLFGVLLSLPFKKLFYRIGEDGLWIGLCITFLYAGILQSYIGRGQSLAKKLLKIQVLRRDGSYLSLKRSFLRYTIIALICYNSWIWMALTSILPFLNNPFLQFIYIYGIFFLLLGVVVLVAFHPLKRGLHDFLADSLVVRKGMYDSEKINFLNIPSKVKRSFAIWGGCFLILIIGSFYIFQKQKSQMHLVYELSPITKKIKENTQFTNIAVRRTWYTFRNNRGTVKQTTSIDVLPFLNKAKFDNLVLQFAEIEKAVDIVIDSYPDIKKCDYINIQVRTGFNIGIFSYYFRQTQRFTTDGKWLTKK